VGGPDWNISRDAVLFGEDPDNVGATLHLLVEPLELVGDQYEVCVPMSPLRFSGSRRMVRPSGTEAPGARKCGQADAHDELRARVSSWPPLRLAQLRRERGSVGVVSPAAPVTMLAGGADATCNRFDIH
jgi:hypothetical protein